MRSVVLKLHLCVALATGFFIVILGITGSIMAFEPELDHLFHPRLFYVTPRPKVLTLADLGAMSSHQFPGERIAGFGLSTSPDLSYYVAYRSGVVYVNQYTGAVLGIRQGSTFLSNVHQLHLRLLAGEVGKTIVSWAGVAMLFLLLTGSYLWWPLKRMTVDWNGSAHRFSFDLHNVVGIFSLAFLLLLTLTGIAIGFDSVAVPFLYKVTQSRPLPTSFSVAPPWGAKSLTPDQAVAIAREALPGALPILVNLPAPTVSYRVAARYPEDLTPGGRSRVHIDQYSGRVLLAESSRTTSAGTRLVIVNRAIHTGDIFGIPSKAVASLASLAAVVQVITGVTIWWKRRR